MNSNALSMQPIGFISSCYKEKFGIPRQPNLVTAARATLTLVPPYNQPETVRGLESFSHIWIIFVFHATQQQGWHPTVRPPRLGGNTRMGVFATRSTFRPNPLGLSVAKLCGIQVQGSNIKLELTGTDLLDGTPVLDIKPYLPYSDSIAEAVDGYPDDILKKLQTVRFSSQAEQFCQYYQKETGRNLMEILREILENDPRPASQKTKKLHFGMTLWNVNIRWRVENESAEVTECHLRENQNY